MLLRRGFEVLRNMERVQRLSASPGHQTGIRKAYQGDKKAGGHTGNPVHQGRADFQGFANQPGVQLCQAECPAGLEAFGIPTGIRTQSAAKNTGRRPSSRKYGTGTVQPDKRHRSRRAVISGRTLAQTQEKETKKERFRIVVRPFPFKLFMNIKIAGI